MLHVTCMCPFCLNGNGECKNKDYVDEWRGFDMNKYQAIAPNFNHLKSIQIRKTVGSCDDFNWNNLVDTLSSKNYEDLELHIARNPLPFLDIHIQDNLCEEDRDNLNMVALHYIPPDAPQGYVPCRIASDRNCFPRALSFVCYRTQEMHLEMRV